MPSACQQLTRAIIELAEFILTVLLLYAVYALPQPEWFSITFYIGKCVTRCVHIMSSLIMTIVNLQVPVLSISIYNISYLKHIYSIEPF